MPAPDGQRPWRPDLTLTALWATRVAERPHAVALMDAAGATVTFRALDEFSNRLARQLTLAGVSPGSVVAVAAEPGPAAVVAFWAVVKARAGFLGLDPDQPPEQLAAIMADARPVLILVDGRPLPTPAPRPVFDLNDEGLYGQTANPLPDAPVATDLAALVYVPAPPSAAGHAGAASEHAAPTTPLALTAAAYAHAVAAAASPALVGPAGLVGVPLTHGALANAMAAAVPGNLLFHQDEPVALATAPLAADGYLFDRIFPLTRGARVVLASLTDLAAPNALAALVARERITVHITTPDQLDALTADPARGAGLADLRVLAWRGPVPSA
ncbi:MAG: AMP-binding protein, partial [Propionibacteriaceae bacterium]|nr:AMP-binding protein [Propionibacteriaceae bacterium]